MQVISRLLDKYTLNVDLFFWGAFLVFVFCLGKAATFVRRSKANQRQPEIDVMARQIEESLGLFLACAWA